MATIGGVDIEALVSRLSAVRVFKGTEAEGPVVVRVVSPFSPDGHGRFARAWLDPAEIVMVHLPGMDPAHVAVTVMHEMVHLSGRWDHDRAFRGRLFAAAKEAYPEADFTVAGHRRIWGTLLEMEEAIETAIAPYVEHDTRLPKPLRWLVYNVVKSASDLCGSVREEEGGT